MSLAPVSRLADDTLIEIFWFHAPTDMSGVDSWNDTWLNIIHVCRRWRYVAVEFSPFWTNIISTLPDLADFMIKNSKQLPLSLDLDITALTHNSVWARRTVKPFSSRIRSLRISYTSSTAVERLLETFREHPAPSLASLTLFWRATTGHDHILRTKSFLDLSFPSLTTLTLHDCSFVSSPTMSFAKCLKTLTIRCNRVDAIIPILRHTPCLLKLSIGILETSSSATYYPFFDSNTDSSLINLLHLGILTFNGPPKQYVRLIERISIPAETIMKLNFSPSPSESHHNFYDDYQPETFESPEWKSVFQDLESRCIRRQEEFGRPFHHVFLDVYDDGRCQNMCLRCYADDTGDSFSTDDIQTTAHENCSTIRPDLSLAWSLSEDSDREDVLGSSYELATLLWPRLPFEFITSIRAKITTDKGPRILLWTTMLQNTPSIESLAVDSAYSSSTVRDLLDPTLGFAKYAAMGRKCHSRPVYGTIDAGFPTQKDVRKAHIHLHNLRTLVIYGDYFDPDIISTPYSDALQAREDAGLPRLSLLKLKRCTVSGREELSLLEGLVDRVVCDVEPPEVDESSEIAAMEEGVESDEE